MQPHVSVLVLTAVFCFYILLLYLGDTLLRWRFSDHSLTYVIIRLLVAFLFLGAGIALFWASVRTSSAAFYGLQGLFLFLNFIIQAILILRSFLGAFHWNNFQEEPFRWVLLILVSIYFGLICPAFVLIFQGYHSDMSRMLVTAGGLLVHSLLGCLTIGQLDRSGMLDRTDNKGLAPLCVSGVTIIAMPVSIFLFDLEMATFLLAHLILSSIVTTSWIVLMLCNLKRVDITDPNQYVSHIE